MFIYHRAQGYWSWCDRGDQHTQYGKFDTRLEALFDAVEPYLVEDKPDISRIEKARTNG